MYINMVGLEAETQHRRIVQVKGEKDPNYS